MRSLSRRRSNSEWLFDLLTAPIQISCAVATVPSAIMSPSSSPVRSRSPGRAFALARASRSSGSSKNSLPSDLLSPSFSAVSQSSRRTASHLALNLLCFAVTIGSMSEIACSTGSGYLMFTGENSYLSRFANTFFSGSAPRCFRAVTPTTGSPSRREIISKSSETPLRRASSMRFTHTTVLGHISAACITRAMLLSMRSASQTTVTAYGEEKQSISRAASSSAECGVSEYVPGRSATVYSAPPSLTPP